MTGSCNLCDGEEPFDIVGDHVAHRAPCGAWCGAAPYGADDARVCGLHAEHCDVAPRDPREHDLKSAVPLFGPVFDGSKNFDIRRNDRGFREGDTLLLREYDPERGYTGRVARRRVTFVLRGYFALQEGFVVMGLGYLDAHAPRPIIPPGPPRDPAASLDYFVASMKRLVNVADAAWRFREAERRLAALGLRTEANAEAHDSAGFAKMAARVVLDAALGFPGPPARTP